MEVVCEIKTKKNRLSRIPLDFTSYSLYLVSLILYLFRSGEMKKNLLCLLLCVAIFYGSGCAGREANLVQIRQLGDEQKTCDALRTELYFVDNEIARLLPKSDKTGKNIALGATGLIFIIPLFFMDLKGGEKKEIEAYRQRYNHLLMISQQRDCKLPPPVTKETAKKSKTSESSNNINEITTCSNCNEMVGRIEKRYVFEGHIVCATCSIRLKEQKEFSLNK